MAWTMPPAGSKDLRDWFQKHVPTRPKNEQAVTELAAKLAAALAEHRKAAKPTRRSAADVLVELATASYPMGVTDAGDAFAVTHDGPNAALVLKGSATALRAKPAKAYRGKTVKTPPAAELGDALTRLHGLALDAEPESLTLRTLTPADAEDWEAKLRDAGLGDNTTRRTTGRAQQVMRDAKPRKLIDANPFAGLAAGVRPKRDRD